MCCALCSHAIFDRGGRNGGHKRPAPGCSDPLWGSGQDTAEVTLPPLLARLASPSPPCLWPQRWLKWHCRDFPPPLGAKMEVVPRARVRHPLLIRMSRTFAKRRCLIYHMAGLLHTPCRRHSWRTSPCHNHIVCVCVHTAVCVCAHRRRCAARLDAGVV